MGIRELGEVGAVEEKGEKIEIIILLSLLERRKAGGEGRSKKGADIGTSDQGGLSPLFSYLSRLRGRGRLSG